jgi:hypothetical protein
MKQQTRRFVAPHLPEREALLVEHAACVGQSVLRSVSAREWFALLSNQLAVARLAVPMLELASRGALAASDTALHEYFARHALEEAGHDAWVEDDLRRTGLRLGLVSPDKVHPALQHGLACHMSALTKGDYATLLGHMWVIEGHPPSMELIDDIARSTTLGRECVSTHMRHAEIDIVHRRELACTIALIADDRRQYAHFLEGCRWTAIALCRLWLSLLKDRSSSGFVDSSPNPSAC